MVAKLKDMSVLAADTTFQARVQAAAISYCLSIVNEPVTTAFHRQRIRFTSLVLNRPGTHTPRFANSVAADGLVIKAATDDGNVELTPGNVATRQALVTDAHLSAAVAAQWNGYFKQGKRSWVDWMYQASESSAKLIKAPIQMFIGAIILAALYFKAKNSVAAILNDYALLFDRPTLEIVGKGLAYSAGIELVYMLFTDGPDEALDPPMMGIAAAILVIVSKIETLPWGGLTTALLVAGLAGLFATKKFLFTKG